MVNRPSKISSHHTSEDNSKKSEKADISSIISSHHVKNILASEKVSMSSNISGHHTWMDNSLKSEKVNRPFKISSHDTSEDNSEKANISSIISSHIV